jgi:heme-degrading monooxygenase HmoA
MILELAILNVIPGQESAFEAAFSHAVSILTSMRGYSSHELRRCVEHADRYILLVHWQSLEDHTVGFRTSPEYQQWKALLHHFYDPFPTVEHYGEALSPTSTI